MAPGLFRIAAEVHWHSPRIAQDAVGWHQDDGRIQGLTRIAEDC